MQADSTITFSSTYFFPASSFLNYYCYFSDLKRWLFGNNRKKSIYAEIVFERTCCHAFYCTCCVDSRRSLHFVIIVLWLEHQFTTKTLMCYVERSMTPISLLIFILYLAKQGPVLLIKSTYLVSGSECYHKFIWVRAQFITSWRLWLVANLQQCW